MAYPDQLAELNNEIIADRRFKHLQQPGVNFVGGHGPLNPKLMLIGEAPGKMENARLIPFQGPAGINLTNLLLEEGIAIADCYLTNTLKFWPWELRVSERTGEEYKGTRAPTLEECRVAREYLLREIEIVDPQYVGLCGKVPTKTLFPGHIRTPISDIAGKLLEGNCVPLYHPSLLGYSPHREPEIRAAYKKLANYLIEERAV